MLVFQDGHLSSLLGIESQGGIQIGIAVLVFAAGFGVAAAVLIDAALVRTLLVGSLMAVLGDWNWWAGLLCQARAELRRLNPAR